uniref:Uncharacterized protein n=1 Tax=Branchiostoma floridae TaxID=7739 RepID=C3YZA5_BRAFL|eukprot:XP_002598164.1 hypothetical protein BRAFLDRAFT_123313 [Branchiostoma floridae]
MAGGTPRTKQGAAVVNGVHTDVVCTGFGDSIFVVVTQYQKLGTLVQVVPGVSADGTSAPTYTTRVLLGKDEPMTHVFARSLGEKICPNNDYKPFTLAVALKDWSPQVLHAAEELVLQNKVW